MIGLLIELKCFDSLPYSRAHSQNRKWISLKMYWCDLSTLSLQTTRKVKLANRLVWVYEPNATCCEGLTVGKKRNKTLAAQRVCCVYLFMPYLMHFIKMLHWIWSYANYFSILLYITSQITWHKTIRGPFYLAFL